MLKSNIGNSILYKSGKNKILVSFYSGDFWCTVFIINNGKMVECCDIKSHLFYKIENSGEEDQLKQNLLKHRGINWTSVE